MTSLRIHTGIVAPMNLDNIDTDQIIPSREMKTVGKSGLGKGLFAGWRYTYDGGKKTGLSPDFVLNKPAFREATVLLGGRNFGCGSSREHAVWALRDYGFQILIAESFGRIFANNCARNRVLAMTLDAKVMQQLHAHVARTPGMALTVNLMNCTISLDQDTPMSTFQINALDRQMLLEGLDHVDFALQHTADIDAFVERDRTRRAWSYLDRKR